MRPFKRIGALLLILIGLWFIGSGTFGFLFDFFTKRQNPEFYNNWPILVVIGFVLTLAGGGLLVAGIKLWKKSA